MKQLTRDLYTSGRVWLSLSHSFTQSSGDYTFDLVKVNRDFVTFNAGALFVLSFWSTGVKTPNKFYIPEYKVDEFKMILEALQDLKEDEAYVRDGELTDKGKATTLYYRLVLNNKKYFDAYFVENNFNGDKAINIAIEFDGKVYFLYDSNVADLIDIIPSPKEIVKYKQSAAELFYTEMRHNRVTAELNSIRELLSSSESTPVKGTKSTPATKKSTPTTTVRKKAEPRKITKVDRTNINKEEPAPEPEKEAPIVVPEVSITPEAVVVKQEIETPEAVVVTPEPEKLVETSKSGIDYSSLLADED